MLQRLLVLPFVLLPMISQAYIDVSRDEIRQRIQPVGVVNVKANPAAVTPAVAAEPKKVVLTAESIYQKHCALCHAAGVAGAPVFQQAAAWGPRKKAKGLDGLTKSAIKGLNAMPARGTCTECSDADIQKVIVYMLPK